MVVKPRPGWRAWILGGLIGIGLLLGLPAAAENWLGRAIAQTSYIRFFGPNAAIFVFSNAAHAQTISSNAFYVAPSGNDSNPGAFDRPFRTLIKARDAMRNSSSKKTTYLRDGTYRLTNTLTLNESDNGVSLIAYPGETPRLIGSTQVTGGAEVTPGICAWNRSIGNGIARRQIDLWVDDNNDSIPTRQIPSRFPNMGTNEKQGWTFTSSAQPTQKVRIGDTLVPVSKIHYKADVGTIESKIIPNESYLVIFDGRGFIQATQTITGVDRANNTFTLTTSGGGANIINQQPGMRFFVGHFGGKSDLDATGEWMWHAGDNKVYWKRPSGISCPQTAELASLDTAISINHSRTGHVSDITVEALTFQFFKYNPNESSRATVELKNADRSKIVANAFKDVGNGILGHDLRDSRINDNSMRRWNLGMRFWGGNENSLRNQINRNTLEDQIGCWEGGWHCMANPFMAFFGWGISFTDRNEFAHNLVKNHSHYSFNVFGKYMWLHHNHVINYGRECRDCGSFYSTSSGGNHIWENNLIQSTYDGVATDNTGSFVDAKPHVALYMDEGADRFIVRKNWVQDSKECVLFNWSSTNPSVGMGNRVTNNFCNLGTAQNMNYAVEFSTNNKNQWQTVDTNIFQWPSEGSRSGIAVYENAGNGCAGGMNFDLGVHPTDDNVFWNGADTSFTQGQFSHANATCQGTFSQWRSVSSGSGAFDESSKIGNPRCSGATFQCTGVKPADWVDFSADILAVGPDGVSGGVPPQQPPPPLSVSITSPADGTTVSGNFTVTASASDNIGVQGVQFKFDGMNVGNEDTTAPYSLSINSTTATDGPHTLTAVARDQAGNQTTSQGVTINIANASPTPPPPPPPPPPPDGLYHFQDDFESYTVGRKDQNFNNNDMFRSFGGPWTQMLQKMEVYGENPGVVLEVTNARAFSGSKSVHMLISKSELDACVDTTDPDGKCSPKNSLIKDDRVEHDQWEFKDGEIMSTSAYYYLPSATNQWASYRWAPMFMDVGINGLGLVSELRVNSWGDNQFSSPGSFELNRKFDNSRLGQTGLDADINVAVPRDKWFKIELRFKVGILPNGDPRYSSGYGGFYPFDPNAEAWLQLIIDDQIVLAKTATTRDGVRGDGFAINSVELGITVSRAPAEFFMDDVVIEGVSEPFVEGTTPPPPPPPASTKFQIGDRVKTTDNLNVRATPSLSGTLLGMQPIGSLGTVVGAPVLADGFWWWNVDYDNAPDGWSAEGLLGRATVRTSYVRPFGPNAPWNIPVSLLATDPDSDELARVHYNHSPSVAGSFRLINGTFDGKWTRPIYDAADATGNFKVVLTNPTWGNLHGRTAPWNPAWRIPAGTDKEITVLNYDTGEEWDYWKVVFDGTTLTMGNGTLVQKVVAPETAWGDPASFYEKENGWRASLAIGLPALAGTVLAEEVQQGVIQHALQTAGINNGDGCTSRAPATKQTRPFYPCGTANNRIPIGTRFALNVTDAEIDAHLNSLPPDIPQKMKDSLRVIAVALRDYGWILTDHGGGAVAFRMEHTYSGGSIWKALEMDDRVASNGKHYPREALNGLITQKRIYALVPSDQYNLPPQQPPPPPQPPPLTVSITSPADGTTVSGNFTVTASASDNVGVAGVQFKLDGQDVGGEDTTSPYSLSWNTTTATDGAHTLTACARDAAGNITTSSGIAVTVDNSPPPDTTPPTVSMTAPANNATVSGSSVTVSATASDDVGVVGVQFKVDGADLGGEDTTNSYGVTWNTTTAANGSHTLTAVARDAAGNITTSSSVSVTVDNVTPASLTVQTLPGTRIFLKGNYGYLGKVKGTVPQSGELRIENLLPGHYVVRAKLRNFLNAYRLVELVPGENVLRLDLALHDPKASLDPTAQALEVDGVAIQGGGDASAPFVVDWNMDGNKDLLVAGGDGAIVLYQNEGSDAAPQLSAGAPVMADGVPIAVPGLAFVFMADWDSDGGEDLVVGDGQGRVRWYRNTLADLTPQWAEWGYLQAGGVEIQLAGPAAPIVIDWDSDGKKDLLVGAGDGTVQVFLNQVTDVNPVLAAGVAISLPDVGVARANARPFVADLNQDDGKDLLVGDANGEVYVFLNSGTDPVPVFTTGSPLTGAGTPVLVSSEASPFPVDWNNDGLPDLVIGSNDGEVFLVQGMESAAPVAPAGDAGGGAESAVDLSCFIATAAYGSPLAPQVQLLRQFRDRYLLPHAPGQALVSLYYTLSPPLAKLIAGSEVLRAIVRAGLAPIVAWAALVLWSPALGLAVLLGALGLAAWLVLRLARRCEWVSARCVLPLTGKRTRSRRSAPWQRLAIGDGR